MADIGGLTFLGCGDVEPYRPPLDFYAEKVEPTFAVADLRFAQCERAYSERGELAADQAASGGSTRRLGPELAEIFALCHFDVVSVASNHTMDWGPEALLDTLDCFRDLGIATVGAGRDDAAAHEAARFERNGVRVGLLGYCSVLREGFEAGPDRPGIAPLRAHTTYEAHDYQPGTPPHVRTTPYEADLAAFERDVRELRDDVDAVVVSLHWGVHGEPRLVADYQKTIARIAVDCGADLIVGSHAHIPKAIEVIEGRVCFYSVGSLVPTFVSKLTGRFAEDPPDPAVPVRRPLKRSVVARARMGREGIGEVAFLPTIIEEDLQPEILAASDPRFADVVAFMEWASEGFDHTFTRDGDAILVT